MTGLCHSSRCVFLTCLPPRTLRSPSDSLCLSLSLCLALTLVFPLTLVVSELVHSLTSRVSLSLVYSLSLAVPLSHTRCFSISLVHPLSLSSCCLSSLSLVVTLTRSLSPSFAPSLVFRVFLTRGPPFTGCFTLFCLLSRISLSHSRYPSHSCSLSHSYYLVVFLPPRVVSPALTRYISLVVFALSRCQLYHSLSLWRL